MKEDKSYWSVYAIMRFLLAFIVIASHLTDFTKSIGIFKYIGYFGAFEAILGFLLISGFSIGKSILKDKKGYFKRRVQRIYPIYFASIIYEMIIFSHALSMPIGITILINVVFLNHILIASSYVGPAWTLSLEVWLYCLAPYLLKLSYNKMTSIIYCSFIAYCIYTLGRSIFHWPYFSGTNYGINLLTLSFTWIAGFTLAIFPNKYKTTALIILGFFTIHYGLTTLIQGYSRIKHDQLDKLISEDLPIFIGNAICIFLIYFYIVHKKQSFNLNLELGRVFVFLGNISYPLYLTHYTTYQLCKTFNINNYLFMVIAALIVATLFYLIFDSYSKKRESLENKFRLIKLNLQYLK